MLADEPMRADRADREVFPLLPYDDGAIEFTVEHRALVLKHGKESVRGPTMPFVSAGLVEIDGDALSRCGRRRPVTHAIKHAEIRAAIMCVIGPQGGGRRPPSTGASPTCRPRG